MSKITTFYNISQIWKIRQLCVFLHQNRSQKIPYTPGALELKKKIELPILTILIIFSLEKQYTNLYHSPFDY